MSIDNESRLRLTYALRDAETVLPAIEALAGADDAVAVDGLLDLIYAAPRGALPARPTLAASATGVSAASLIAAAGALRGCRGSVALDALESLLHSPWPSVRAAAIEAIRERLPNTAASNNTSSRSASTTVPAEQRLHLLRELLRITAEDGSWTVRRHALQAAADVGREELARDPTEIFVAAGDPHWRVRHALIDALPLAAEVVRLPSAIQFEYGASLASPVAGARACGVAEYLRWRASGRSTDPSRPAPAEDSAAWCPFWDWDPAVLARTLDEQGERRRRLSIDIMPRLAAHGDEAVRRRAVAELLRWGEPRHLADAAAVLDDSRNAAFVAVARLLDRVDRHRREQTVVLLFVDAASPPGALAWAVDQLEDMLPVEPHGRRLEELLDAAHGLAPLVRRALAALAARWRHPRSPGWLLRLLDDPDAPVRLAAARGLALREDAPTGWWRACLRDPHPELRAEAAGAAAGAGGIAQSPESAAEFDALLRDWSALVRARLARALAEPYGADAASRPAPTAAEIVLLDMLQRDEHPRVRAAALTPWRAEQLLEEPLQETSWGVIATAARICRRPLWELEPRRLWRPEEAPNSQTPPIVPSSESVADPRVEPASEQMHKPAALLGPAALPVSRIAVSGHYGLPEAGFARAIERGINLFFWEPNYDTLTRFAARISPARRRQMHFIAGTFEAEPRRIRSNAERVLRRLEIERLDLFLLFWVRSWLRVSDEVRETLDELRQSGLVLMTGLSTHSLPLAAEAIDEGFNPVMVRHSAAHRRAEESVFPQAEARGTSLLAFNNTCYGRLLEPVGASPGVAAADCYRYTLSHPAVTAALSAPSTLEQLEENLAALDRPELDAARRRALLEHGDLVYREDCVFRDLVRGVP